MLQKFPVVQMSLVDADIIFLDFKIDLPVLRATEGSPWGSFLQGGLPGHQAPARKGQGNKLLLGSHHSARASKLF